MAAIHISDTAACRQHPAGTRRGLLAGCPTLYVSTLFHKLTRFTGHRITHRLCPNLTMDVCCYRILPDIHFCIRSQHVPRRVGQCGGSPLRAHSSPHPSKVSASFWAYRISNVVFASFLGLWNQLMSLPVSGLPESVNGFLLVSVFAN